MRVVYLDLISSDIQNMIFSVNKKTHGLHHKGHDDKKIMAKR